MMRPEIERCRGEIAGIEAQLRTGDCDLQGLLLALSDWHAELRLLEREALNSRKEVPSRTRNIAILSAPRGAPDVEREHLEVA
jgi:hypothetical protein